MAKPFLYAHDECLSPDKTTMALIEDSNIGFDDPERAKRVAHLVVRRLQPPRADLVVRAENEDPAPSRTILGWREDGQEFYFLSVGAESSSVWAVSRDANARMLYREEAGLSVPSSLSEVSRDGRTIVVVRSTNTTPDELIKLDLATGKVTVLASPNQKFQAANVAVVRLMRIACCGHDLYGRLYLPRRRVSGKKYPLVFTNYLSTPGFDASVGDEVPILPLVEHGIAVFALHSKPANIISRSQDFRFEIQRVAQPLEAMEWVRRQLADEGIIDPARCGLSGLSYGAEIAMYAYWKSRAFRAISIASASWEPSNYLLAGINYAEFLNSRGLSVLDAEWRSRWAELSASLNLRPAMPPLLMQSSDQEEYFGNVELWFQLRRRGLPVEWHLFPNEGHVKRSPADRWWIYQRNLDWFLFWLCGQADRDPTKAAQYVRWEAMKKTADPVE
jgi:dipeptidyl aminopeptidase/acylaminoacyl peptidase